MNTKQPSLQLGRRAFLQQGSLVLGASLTVSGLATSTLAEDAKVKSIEHLRIGLVTDLHYADKPAGGSRHYRETLGKLATAGEQFSKSKLNFVVELGDLVDKADSVETELGYLKRVNAEFKKIHSERHYVLGNHCIATLTKAEFLGEVEQKKSYYSFNVGGYHFVVLDSCFRSDGVAYARGNFKWTDANIPRSQLDWLAADLAATTLPTIVFAHQRLDVSTAHGVKNCVEVRKILESSKRVLAVFQGHSHKNDYHEINGIHYCTLVAMVEGAGTENNGFSVLTCTPTALKLDGFVRQSDRNFETE